MENKTPSLLESDDEITLVNGLIDNNDSAYEALVKNYSAKMYAVARRFFNLDDDAQECVQKAFIQVFKNILSFKRASRLTTWLHRITVNEALMMLRQRKKLTTTSLESFAQQYNEYGERTVFSDTSDINQVHNLSNNIEMLFERNETKLSLNEIIYQLPEKYCNVILLRDIQEMNTKETAEILAISEASVKTQLHRARLLLKEVLELKDIKTLEKNWKVK